MSYIQLNYAFLLFWSIFELILWKLLFLVQKVTILEWSSEILVKIVFLNTFEKGKIQRKIFLYKAVKRDKYEQKLFFSTKWATYS